MNVRHRRLLALVVVLLASMAAACSDGSSVAVDDSTTSATSTTSTTSTATTVLSTTTSTTTTSITTTSSTTTTPTTTTTTTTTTTSEPPPAFGELDAAGLLEWPPFPLAGPLDGVAALTGLPADDEVTARPVLAVKVDNAGPARPQWGLADADVIFEINVEGVTRFIAMYHSNVPSEVGPVRSGRASDLAVLAAANRPLLAWSGGNPGVTAEVRHAAASGVLENLSALDHGGCYRREGSRRSPNNLIVSTGCLYQRAAGGPARLLWTFDPEWQPPPGLAYGPDSTFDVAMDGVRVTWRWDPGLGRYLRSQSGSPHVTVGGGQVSAANVVRLQVPHAPSRIDARSPEAFTVGSGPMILHRDGIATLGTWQRNGPYEPFSFLAGDGSEMSLRPGTTFVHVARQ